MSYQCGIYFPNFYQDPCIVCDKCGFKLKIKIPPPNWFLNRKNPPKWKTKFNSNERCDLCPRCK